MRVSRRLTWLTIVAVLSCLIAAVVTGALPLMSTAPLAAVNPVAESVELVALVAVQIFGTAVAAGLLMQVLLVWKSPPDWIRGAANSRAGSSSRAGTSALTSPLRWRVRLAWLWVAVALVGYLATLTVVVNGQFDVFGNDPSVLLSIAPANALLASAVCAGIVAIAGESADSSLITALVAVVLIGVAIPALAGHGADASAAAALPSAVLHSVAACLWMAGVLALVSVGSASSLRLRDSARRFGWLAIGCVLVLAITGLFNALIRMSNPSQLFTTAFGWLVVIKLILLVGLMVIAAPLRLRVVEQLVGARPRTTFLTITSMELVLLAIAVGLGIALAQSPVA